MCDKIYTLGIEMNKDGVVQYLKEKRVARAKELLPFIDHPFELRRMDEAGYINSLGGGFYAHASVDSILGGFAVVARFYPKAVISGLSALHFYELTDQSINYIDVDIPRTTSIRNELIKPHRVNANLMIGIDEVSVESYTVKIYSPERALCDAIKLFGKGEIFYKALKRYMARKDKDTVEIARLDRILRTDVLGRVAQEFADG